MTLTNAPRLQPTRLALGAHLADGEPPPPNGQATGAPSPQAVLLEKPPTTSDDLTDLAQEQYNLEEDAAVTLGFSVVTLKPDVKHDVLVYQVARYKDIADTAGNTYRFGIAVEATIVATVDKFEGGVTLPAIAANVQLDHSTASSDLSVRGYAFKSPTTVSLPPWGSFDVDSYTTFQADIDKVVGTVLFDDANIKPVLLATSAPVIDDPDVKPPSHRFVYRIQSWLSPKEWASERLRPDPGEPEVRDVPQGVLQTSRQ